MKITINDRRKVFAIQESFNTAFPGLTLQFFAKPSKVGGAPSRKRIQHAGATLGDCRTSHEVGTVTITGNMTVKELERRLSDVYGLSVQVLRRSGQKWLRKDVALNSSLSSLTPMTDEDQ